jgi:hypothetical protein
MKSSLLLITLFATGINLAKRSYVTVLKLRVKSNAKSGTVKEFDYNVGFSDPSVANQNNTYQSCTHF